MLTNLIAASAPGNYPLINPVAWQAFIDTGGLSAVRGVRALTQACPPPRSAELARWPRGGSPMLAERARMVLACADGQSNKQTAAGVAGRSRH